MAYVTQQILSEALTAEKVSALVPVAADITRTIALAEAEVEGALLNGGYAAAVPATVYAADASDAPDLIKLAAIGAWLRIAYGRHDIAMPEDFRLYVAKVDEIRRGSLEIPGVAKTVSRSVGGVDFSLSSPSVSVSDGSRPQIFSRRSMRGF